MSSSRDSGYRRHHVYLALAELDLSLSVLCLVAVVVSVEEDSFWTRQDY